MARSVGSIEVTVDANTGKLKAQLVKDLSEAGRAGAAVLQRELDNIDAAIDFDKDRIRANAVEIRKTIEAAMRGIEVGFDPDTVSMRAALREFEAEVEALDLAINMHLSERDIGEINAQLRAFEANELSLRAKIDIAEGETTGEIETLKRQIEAQLRGIDVGIDVGAAKAKLAELEAQAEAIDLAIHVHVSQRDLAEINANVEAFTAAQRDAKIQFEADLSTINSNVERFLAEQREMHIRAQIDFDRAVAELAAFEETARRRALQLPIQGDFDRINAQLDALRVESVLARGIDIKVGADVRDAEAAILALDAQIGQMEAGIKVEMQLAEALAVIETFRKLQEADHIHLTADVDVDAMEARLRSALEGQALAAQFEKMGESSGSSFGGGFGHGLSLQEAAIVGAVLLLAEPISVALAGALSAAVAVASSAFSALAGAAGAALPIIAGFAPVIGGAVIGFHGMSGAIKAVNKEMGAAAAEGRAFNLNAKGIQDAMKGLAPAAQAVAGAFADVLPKLQAVQREVQGRLFEGLARDLRLLAQTALPSVGQALADGATSFNKFIHELSDLATGIDFAGLFKGLQPAIDAVFRALVDVLGAFQPFLRAATPAAVALAQSIERVAASFRGMVAQGAASGAITRFLQEGLVSLRVWASLLGNVGRALFTLFQAGKATGDGFVRSLSNIVSQFNEWMRSLEGQQALANFFEFGRESMQALVPLLRGIQGFFDKLITPAALARFETLSDSLGRALPFLGDLLDLIARTEIVDTFAEAVARIGEAFQSVLDDLKAFADNVGNVLGGALRAITPLFAALATFVGNLAADFNGLSTPIQAVALALGALVLLRGPLGGMFSGLGKSLTGLHTSIGLIGPALRTLKNDVADTFAAFRSGGLKAGASPLLNVGKDLVIAAKGAGALAGSALALGLAASFALQMADSTGGMIGAVEHVMTDVSTFVTGFFLGGGGITGAITGAAAVAVSELLNMFNKNAAKAREAKQEIEGVAKAWRNLSAEGRRSDAINRALDDFAKLAPKVQDAFNNAGLDLGDFVTKWVNGTGDAKTATTDWLNSLGDGGKVIGALVASGKLSLAELSNSFHLFAEGHRNDSDTIQAAFEDIEIALANQGVPVEQITAIITFLSTQYDKTSAAAIQFARSSEAAGGALDSANDVAGQTAQIWGEVGGIMVDTTGAATGLGHGIGLIEPPDPNIKTEFQKIAESAAAIRPDVRDARIELSKMNDVFVRLGDREQALSSVFKLFDFPRDNAAKIRDINVAIHDLSDAAKGIDLSKAIDFTSIKADDFLDALDDLRPQIEEQITNMFSAGGPKAAKKLTADYIARVAKQLHISKIDATKLLGLDNITTKINVAIELTRQEEAQHALDAFQSVIDKLPEDVQVEINTHIAEGDITGAVAILNRELVKRHYDPIVLPTDADTKGAVQAAKDARTLAQTMLQPPVAIQFAATPQAKAAMVEANAAIAATPIVVPVAPPALVPAINQAIGEIPPGAVPPVNIPFTAASPQAAIVEAMSSLPAPTPVSIPLAAQTTQIEGDIGALISGPWPTIEIPVEAKLQAKADALAGFVSSMTGIGQGVAQSVTIPVTLDDSAAKTGLDNLGTQIVNLPSGTIKIATPTIPTNKADVQSLTDKTNAVPTSVTQNFNQPDIGAAIGRVSDLDSKTRGLKTDITQVFHTNGFSEVLNNISTISSRADALDGKQIDINIVTHGTIPTGAGAEGGIAKLGGAWAAERGSEMVVYPSGEARFLTGMTRVPAGTVMTPLAKVPGVATASGQTQPVIAQKVVNNYMTINTPVEDPALVAVQVMNRAASMANV